MGISVIKHEYLCFNGGSTSRFWEIWLQTSFQMYLKPHHLFYIIYLTVNTICHFRIKSADHFEVLLKRQLLLMLAVGTGWGRITVTQIFF